MSSEKKLPMRPHGMKGLLSRIDRVAGKLEKVTRITCGAVSSSMVAIVTSGVVARYLMRNPMVWTEEISRILMIWTAFLGISIAVRQRSHLGVSLVMERMPMSLQRLTKLLTDGLTMWFLYVLTIYGFQMVETSKSQIETATGISMGYFFICVPICGLLSMIQQSAIILIDLSRWGTPISPYYKKSAT